MKLKNFILIWKYNILNNFNIQSWHIGYHRLYDVIKAENILWDTLTNNCKDFVNNFQSCSKLSTNKSLKQKILMIKTKGHKLVIW